VRAVIQRVSRASVEVDRSMIASISKGFMILIGIEHEDSHADIDWIKSKAIKLRIFDDEDGKMNLDINQIQGDVILVSQFTLHASCKKGNRPSFIKAAKPVMAEKLFNKMVSEFRMELGENRVQTGQFGAMMDVDFVNDGPVTILLDSKVKE